MVVLFIQTNKVRHPGSLNDQSLGFFFLQSAFVKFILWDDRLDKNERTVWFFKAATNPGRSCLIKWLVGLLKIVINDI
jgi:hypothetical protein